METASQQPKKVTLACQKCRVLKVKCVRPAEGQPCTKCTRSKSHCIIAEPRQRSRVPQRAKPQLVDLESKLTNLISLLSRSSEPSDEPLGASQAPIDTDALLPAVPDYPGDTPHPTAEWFGQGYLVSGVDEALGQYEHQCTLEKSSETSWTASTAIDATWISDLGLGSVVLEHFLNRFRGMTSYFPFVQLSAAWTVTSIAEEHPFLLLAAVAASSSKHIHLQDALINRFKETLSQRVVLAGDKNLDLLQGLLVHLAWFHFHFIPGNQQTYQYLQIAISMVIDLRLDQLATELLEHRTGLDNTHSREACRTYLGCYYMSSIISMSSGKPNNLQCGDDMLQCALVLQQEPESETDLLIYPVIKVLQFAEDVCETYKAEGIAGTRLHIHAERFTTRLEEWWSSLPPDLRDTVLVVNAYYAVKLRIQEMGLVYCYGQRRPPSQKTPLNATMFSTQSKVIISLTQCVGSAKDYLDWFFTIPMSEYSILPFSAWYQIVLVVFVLYRLSVGLSEVPGWNVEIAHQTLDFHEYLDILLAQLQVIDPERISDREIPSKSLFSRLSEIIGGVKTSYLLASENHDPMQGRDSRHAHLELKAAASPLYRQHRCPALRYSSRHAGQAPNQDALQKAISTEVQTIEDEKLWDDIIAMDTFSSMTESSTT
ncbi:hypothetical protein BJX70DRAFT_408960 [Aspergillus crustosus]